MDRHVLRSPADVLAAVPALLGFVPKSSIVALVLEESSRTLVCSARLDLSTPAPELKRGLLQLTCGERVLLLAVYSDTEPELDWLLQALAQAGVGVVDALLVKAGRYRSMVCDDPSCCPPEGRPMPDQTTTLEAARALQGLPNVADDREDLVARYQLREPLPEGLLQQARQVLDLPKADRCQAAEESLEALVEGEADPARQAELVWLLQDHDVRDQVLCEVGLPYPDHAKVAVILDAAQVAPDDMRPRVAGTAAALLFLTGTDSVGTWAMIGHAGGDSLARLVSRAMSSFLPPDQFRDVLVQARKDIEQRIQASSHAPDLRVPEAC